MQIDMERIVVGARKVLEPFFAAFPEGLDGRIKAAVVTGEAALPGFVVGGTAIELMLLVDQVDRTLLDQVGKAVRPLTRKGLVPPLILTQDELASSLDAFPLEFLTVKATGIVVAGDCELSGLDIKTSDLRVQCERELRGLLLHARMAAVQSGEREAELGRMLAAGSGKLITVLRGLDVLAGGDGKGTVSELTARLAERKLADGDLLESLLARRLQKKPKVTETQWLELSGLLKGLVEWVDGL
jgi:hypothetical protein